MKKIELYIWSIVCFLLICGCASYEPPKNPTTEYTFPNRIDNGVNQGGTSPVPKSTTRVFIKNNSIQLGIDPNLGGAITYLAERGQENIINNFDYGRQIQNSIYSGPRPYLPLGQVTDPRLMASAWNPIQAGDYVGNPAGSTEWRLIDSTQLYVRSIGIQWHLVNFPAECIMEHWYRLKDNAVMVRSRTTIARSDTTFYDSYYQETPAIYVNDPYYRFVSYDSGNPFTNDKLTYHSGKSTAFYASPECWGAMLNNQNRGIGLYRPNVFQFVTSNYGANGGKGDEFANATAYMTGMPVEQIDYNGIYEYEYALVLGSVQDIRKYVYSQPKPTSSPNFFFTNSRQGWSYYNTRDQGWQIKNTLDIHWEATKPDRFRIASPFMFFSGSSIPKLYIQAAFMTNATSAHLIWTRQGDNDFRHKPNQELDFPIIGDGQMRVYEIDMSRVSTWQGYVTRIALEPTAFEGLQKGGTVRIKSITSTRP